jgi:hypothetical protein
MVSMMRLILSIILSICSACLWAEIKVEVQPSSVMQDETFQLTLTQEGSNGAGVPDLSVLQNNFAILGTERHISYSIINGQSTSNSEWVITLKPLKSGVLTIPSIKMGADRSVPMTINVEVGNHPQTPANADVQDALLLETTVDTKTPFVNQQILYTIKLYNSKRLLDAQYQAPQVDQALVIPLGDAKRYQQTRNNINYVVEEQKYAIYPQKSGTLTIISPSFTALIYDLDPQRVKVQDKEHTIDVQPIPQKYQGKPWLPAEQVKLTEHYENTSQTMEQGDTLIRTVTLEGVSVPAQLLPELKFAEGDAYSVYPEKGTERNQIRQGVLVGSIEFKITYLFNKGGKVTIPEFRLPWFNVKTGIEEVASLAPRTIDVKSTTGATQSPTPLNDTHSETMLNSSTPSDAVNSMSSESNWGWIAASFFALAWIITLILLLRRKHPLVWRGQHKAALEQLNKACVGCNPKDARDALLKWAALHWPDAALLNLSDLMSLVRDPLLKKQVNHLSQVLYKTQERTLWRGDELWRAVQATKSAKNVVRKSRPLPPMNPL